MKAFVLEAFDTEPVFADVPVPVPRDNEILICVQGTSVNPVDAMIGLGFFRTVQEYRLPAVLGRDFAGVVAQTGAAVTRFAPGDPVWGFIKREHVGNGTFAEYVTCPADYFVAAKPARMTTGEAGVVGLAAITAQECLDLLDLTAGQTVLINGATGGTGSFAVQIAAAAGLRVIATARPGVQTDFIRALGAHEVVDWTRPGLAEQVGRLAPDGVHGLLDLVRRGRSATAGTDETATALMLAELVDGVVRRDGRVASTTNATNTSDFGGRITHNVHSHPTPAALGRLSALIDRGLVRAPIDRTFAFHQLPEAFRALASGAMGKTAVRITRALDPMDDDVAGPGTTVLQSSGVA